MNKHLVGVLAGVALVALLLPGMASATIVIKLDLPALVQRAGTVFLGKAVKTHSHWTLDRKHIVTDTTFRVQQSLRGAGASGNTVSIRSLGGVVDGIGMRVSGSPVFRKGQEVLLFAEQRGAYRYVVGMTQGAYRVSRDSRGRATVRVNLDGVSLARRTPSGRLELTRGHEVRGARVHELGPFVARIKQEMQRQVRQRSIRPGGATGPGAGAR